MRFLVCGPPRRAVLQAANLPDWIQVPARSTCLAKEVCAKEIDRMHSVVYAPD